LEALKLRKSQLEEQIPNSAFAMMASDYEPHNVQIHVRGSHTNLGKEVPRGFLHFASTAEAPISERESGRMQVADWIASPRNPLTARVMVNRIWKHHFVRGLARTPDNFGVMGEQPTHPELLDYLAARFVESGWSVKAMHRLILLSSVYQISSQPSQGAAQKDPENKLLHSMPVRRLEAEAIRDAMLAVAGTLDGKMYGPSVPPHISKYQDGRGKPESGPVDANGRRSIYIQLRRNFLPPMFLAFDYPLPISTIGARGSSTVPSQALLLLNNEFIAGQAKKWAEQAIATQPDARNRVSEMYVRAFGRPAADGEIDEILSFVRGQSQLPEQQAWTEVAHVLFNSAEFIYVR
jgi:hypothetical protein